MPTESDRIRHLLPFEDYLMSYPVLYDSETKELKHFGFKVDMDYFLMHDWSDLNILHLSNKFIEFRQFTNRRLRIRNAC